MPSLTSTCKMYISVKNSLCPYCGRLFPPPLTVRELRFDMNGLARK